MSVAQISVRPELYGRLHAYAEAHGISMVSVIEAALADESTWDATGLSAKARMPTLDLPADLVLALHREAVRRAEVEPEGDHSTRSLLEEIIIDALDTAGVPR